MGKKINFGIKKSTRGLYAAEPTNQLNNERNKQLLINIDMV